MMYYCKWAEDEVVPLRLDDIVSLYTEIDSEGNVLRELGLNKDGQIVHKCPSGAYKYGTYGLFDNVTVAITSSRSFITKDEFERLWLLDMN